MTTRWAHRQDSFAGRHIGPDDADIQAMLADLGFKDLEAMLAQVVPSGIRLRKELALPAPLSESEAQAALRSLAQHNLPLRSHYGQGYHGTLTPAVVRRNILENPGWYTQYTPYQAEISQGRLELLLNFQTLICELTGLPVANASLLDEATAAAEAMAMMHRLRPSASSAERLLVDAAVHPQTLAVLQTRAAGIGVTLLVQEPDAWPLGDAGAMAEVFGAVVQTPTTDGRLRDVAHLATQLHAAGALLTVGADPLSLLLQPAPGGLGADIVYGSMQRFGVPMGCGGPHAGYFACQDGHKRQMPGRIIGASVDVHGRAALRMALQTREQHIRRNKATSNICTAQVLLAIVATGYAIYHGPAGLRAIALRVQRLASSLRRAAKASGIAVQDGPLFDMVRLFPTGGAPAVAATVARALDAGLLLRDLGDGSLGISLDETCDVEDMRAIARAVGIDAAALDAALDADAEPLPQALGRDAALMPQACFHRYHSETELQRYLARLQARDLSLVQAMIPLGSCTMKLNAAAEMEPISWSAFADVHPFAPARALRGYAAMVGELEHWLCEITGFAACSMQPNAGSQGEYAGLLAIRGMQRAQGQQHRDVCLIPTSAHGTNPATAVMAGLEVIAVACDTEGNIDVADLRTKADQHRARLSCLMVTYPSTHGVFEETIRGICEIVHEAGGQVYMDGANMNAMVGLSRPGDIGADVCHLNLHKTFCIPHGGGGPGMGPICVAAHLRPFLPGHPATDGDASAAVGAVSAAPWGSPSILPIPWMYIRMMGPAGLQRASAVAILSANYLAHHLRAHFPVLYRGTHGLCAHECILDLRDLKRSADISVDDVAKRLMDYGFHAPTMSWPVAGTLMVEPTESEPKAELDRFIAAMISIRQEIAAVERGEADRTDNPLRHAPHPQAEVVSSTWSHSYSREQAAFPSEHSRAHKFWPAVGRVDNAFGDRNLVCTCPTVEELTLG